MTGIAYAANGAAPPSGSPFDMLIMITLMIGVFYFVLLRPQQKKAKEHQEFLNNLKKGDDIVTSGGIHGKITGLTDTIVTVEVADGVRIKVNRPSVLSSAADAAKQSETANKPSGG